MQESDRIAPARDAHEVTSAAGKIADRRLKIGENVASHEEEFGGGRDG